MQSSKQSRKNTSSTSATSEANAEEKSQTGTVSPLINEVWRGTYDGVQQLIDAKADPASEIHRGFNQNLAFFAASRSAKMPGSRLPFLQLLVGQYHVDASALDSNKQTPLFFAAREGDASSCEFLIARHCNPNHRDSLMGQSPLFYAARSGSFECAQLLLDKKCDADSEDHWRQSPLFYAAKAGYPELVQLLLSHKADIHRADTNGQTCLFFAQSTCTGTLLRASCDTQHQDVRGQNAIFTAAEAGDLDRVRSLTAGGAQVHVIDAFGQTCLFGAAKNGHTEVCDALVQEYGVDPIHKDRSGRSAKQTAMIARKSSTAAALEAAEKERLLMKKAQVPIQQTVSSLTAKAEKINEHLYDAVRDKSIQSVRSLLDQGANATVMLRGGGQNLVFLAAARSRGAVGICSLLVHFEADASLVDTALQQTPLFYAVRSNPPGGGLECARYLMTQRCEPDHVDVHGQTPLFYAVQRRDAGCAEALVASSAAVNRVDLAGQTPLFYAVQAGSEACLGALLRAKCDATACDAVGRTPLFRVASASALGVEESILCNMVEVLLHHRCNVNHTDTNGQTVLFDTAKAGADGVLNTLVAAGGDVHLTNSNLETCLFSALGAKSALNTCRLLVKELGAVAAHRNYQGQTAADIVGSNGSATALRQMLQKHARQERQVRKRVADIPLKDATAPALAASPPAQKAARKSYVVVFGDPQRPGKTIPVGTPEYARALRRLVELCPDLGGWESGAQLCGA